MHSTLHRKETGQLLLFSLNTIYGCLIHPAAEGNIHQWTRTEISSSFVITDPQFQLPFLPSYTALLPHLPTYLSLIPSFFQFIHFLSQLHAHTHAHASAYAFTGSDWWLDKVLLMEPPGCLSSSKKKKKKKAPVCAVTAATLLTHNPNVCVFTQLYGVATTHPDGQAKCSMTQQVTRHAISRIICEQTFSFKYRFPPAKLQADGRIGFGGEWVTRPNARIHENQCN